MTEKPSASDSSASDSSASDRDRDSGDHGLDKIRSASVCGDQTRRSSLGLIDQMARIGGQAAAVARMTDDDDFDMDNLER